MSLQPSPIQAVPAETARVAHAAFPKGNPYLYLRDEFGTLFQDEDFAALYPAEGQPALAPWRLAWLTIIQFREGLPDRQAAEAVRARIDIKYLLGLELTDPGFDFSVLCEFRKRLLAVQGEPLLERLLVVCREKGLLHARGQQRTDATHVLAAIRVLNRLELVGETMRAALNALSAVAPEWMQRIAPPTWYQRYARRVEDDRLPKSKPERERYGQTIGEDGFFLLERLKEADTPPNCPSLPEVQTLRQVWERHYQRVEASDEAGNLRLTVRFTTERERKQGAPAIESPYDTEARYRNRYGLGWTGYIVHLTETCEPEQIHLITHVETTPATLHEVNLTEAIHQALCTKQLSPAEHLVDSAYIDANLLLISRETHGIYLCGPTRKNSSWQTKVEGAYDADQFEIDWEQQCVRCPQGKQSTSWLEKVDASGSPRVYVTFAARDCQSCPVRALCTKGTRRRLGFPPRPQYEALQTARAQHASEAGKLLYDRRAGIEGTISQGVRAFGLRCTRYRGLSKTHIQHIATAAAVNLDRLFAWSTHQPHAATRKSHFAKLAA